MIGRGFVATAVSSATQKRKKRKSRRDYENTKKIERQRERYSDYWWMNGSKSKPLMRLTDIKSEHSFRDIRLFVEKWFFPAPPPFSAVYLPSPSCHYIHYIPNNVTKARKREKSYSPPILQRGKSKRSTSTNLICLSEGGTILFRAKARAKCLGGCDERSIFEIQVIILSQ